MIEESIPVTIRRNAMIVSHIFDATMIDKIYNETFKLDDTSIIHFINGLCLVSAMELTQHHANHITNNHGIYAQTHTHTHTHTHIRESHIQTNQTYNRRKNSQTNVSYFGLFFTLN